MKKTIIIMTACFFLCTINVLALDIGSIEKLIPNDVTVLSFDVLETKTEFDVSAKFNAGQTVMFYEYDGVDSQFNLINDDFVVNLDGIIEHSVDKGIYFISDKAINGIVQKVPKPEIAPINSVNADTGDNTMSQIAVLGGIIIIAGGILIIRKLA